MKLEFERNSFSFKPLTLKLTLESMEEAQALFCIFNHVDICAFFDMHSKRITAQDIRNILESSLGKINYSAIWNEISALHKAR